jgi:hypothetical protein
MDGDRVSYAVSYPRSGRTWVQVMLAHVASGLTGIPIEAVLKSNGVLPADRPREAGVPSVEFGHGHLNGRICRGDWFPRERYRGQRVQLQVRDPRDVVVSQYHYESVRYGRFSGSLSEFLRHPFEREDPESARSRFGVMPVINYMNAWVRRAGLFGAFRVVAYEDLREDTAGELAEMCRFFGLEADTPAVEAAVAYGSVDNMRRLEATNELDWYGMPGGAQRRGWKVRRAVVGSHRDELGAEDLEYVEGLIREHLDPALGRYLTPAVAVAGR